MSDETKPSLPQEIRDILDEVIEDRAARYPELKHDQVRREVCAEMTPSLLAGLAMTVMIDHQTVGQTIDEVIDRRRAHIPLYRKEFPDFDDEIPFIPGFVDSSWHNEAYPQVTNEVAGLRLWIDYADPKLSGLPVPRDQVGGKRFSLLKIKDPYDLSKDEPILDSDDLEEILTAYAKAWVEWAAVEGIGPGFHPDTSGDSYEPALAEPLLRQYDSMIEFSFEHLIEPDPYAVGLEAWRAAGMISSPRLH